VVADGIVRYREPAAALDNDDAPAERAVEGFTAIVQWFHNGAWRGTVRGTGLQVWEIIG